MTSSNLNLQYLHQSIVTVLLATAAGSTILKSVTGWGNQMIKGIIQLYKLEAKIFYCKQRFKKTLTTEVTFPTR